jgi:hypothetical protein
LIQRKLRPAQAYHQAMERALAADKADNLAECEKALAEARRWLSQINR